MASPQKFQVDGTYKTTNDEGEELEGQYLPGKGIEITKAPKSSSYLVGSIEAKIQPAPGDAWVGKDGKSYEILSNPDAAGNVKVKDLAGNEKTIKATELDEYIPYASSKEVSSTPVPAPPPQVTKYTEDKPLDVNGKKYYTDEDGNVRIQVFGVDKTVTMKNGKVVAKGFFGGEEEIPEKDLELFKASSDPNLKAKISKLQERANLHKQYANKKIKVVNPLSGVVDEVEVTDVDENGKLVVKSGTYGEYKVNPDELSTSQKQAQDKQVAEEAAKKASLEAEKKADAEATAAKKVEETNKAIATLQKRAAQLEKEGKNDQAALAWQQVANQAQNRVQKGHALFNKARALAAAGKDKESEQTFKQAAEAYGDENKALKESATAQADSFKRAPETPFEKSSRLREEARSEKDPSKALQKYDQALKTAEAAKDKLGLELAHKGKARVYERQKNYAAAAKEFEEAGKAAEQLGDKSSKSSAKFSYQDAQEMYKQAGNNAKAAEMEAKAKATSTNSSYKRNSRRRHY